MEIELLLGHGFQFASTFLQLSTDETLPFSFTEIYHEIHQVLPCSINFYAFFFHMFSHSKLHFGGGDFPTARLWDTSTLPSGACFDFLRCVNTRWSPKKWGECLRPDVFLMIIFYTILYDSIWLLYIDMCNRLICWLIYTCLRIQMIAKYSYEDMCFVSSAFIFVSILVRGFENDPCRFHPH